MLNDKMRQQKECLHQKMVSCLVLVFFNIFAFLKNVFAVFIQQK